MRIPPGVAGVAGVLLARQSMLLPASYCAPECPACREEVANFDLLTSCIANSSFVSDCGHCQTCVMTYAIENGGIDTQSAIEQILYNVLNLCENSTISTEIQSLQSQASLMSEFGKQISTSNSTATTAAMNITLAPTTAQTGTAACTTGVSASAACKSPTSPFGNPTATPDSAAKPTTGPPPLNATWIAGPVLGSVLGISILVVLIIFARRKWRQHQQANRPLSKDFTDDSSNHSSQNPSSQQKPQEPPPPTELENIEVHELPAMEPVGSELSTPMEARVREEDWPLTPLPLSPLPLLFAMSEMRDERAQNVSPKHETFYHP